VADESVVASKARPKKPGNGVEEKTELTISIASDGAPTCQKQSGVAKGGSILQVCDEQMFFFQWYTNRLAIEVFLRG
jgi:hypothetical protein